MPIRMPHPPQWSDRDPGDEQPERSPSEQERVETWVAERFEELGFNEFQAFELAARRADWHEAERLIAWGCSFEQAIDILT